MNSVTNQHALQPSHRAKKLQSMLKDVVTKHPADVLLLSGGIDSSLLGALDPSVMAITVLYEESNLDYRYAKEVSEYLNMRWYPIILSRKEGLQTIEKMIQLEKTYDLAIKGDIPIYTGIQYAKQHGAKIIRTGDGADELFAGYHSLHTKSEEELTIWRRGTIQNIHAPSLTIGQALGVSLDYPYLNSEIVSFANTVTKKEIIQEFTNMGVGDVSQYDDPILAQSKTWGKIILRLAAKNRLPENIVWRPKAPLEYGSGFNVLEDELEKMFSERYIPELKKEKKHFWNKAHAYLYLQYKQFGLYPLPPKEGEYACTWCGGGVITGRRHCKTCGGYPADIQQEGLFSRPTDKNSE